MQEFSFSTRLFFGPGALTRLERVQGAHVLIVTDRMIAASGILERVTAHLANCSVTVFDQVVPDPPVEVVTAGVRALLEHQTQVLIAVGGGSTLDAAKAIRAVASEINTELANMECFAIPTTSGTGSEVTDVAVITDTERGMKLPIASQSLRPMIAILAPELVASVPPKVTADTGMDVLTHAIEAYVARNANDFSDALSEKAISLVHHFLLPAQRDGNDLLAREKLHNASCMAGLAFNSAGLGLAHGLSHALGGKLHLPHGRLNAVVLPHVISFNAQLEHAGGKLNLQVAQKYQCIAQRLNLPATNPQSGVTSLIDAIRQLNRALGISEHLEDLINSTDAFEDMRQEIIANALADSTTASNPRKVTAYEIDHILTQVMYQG